MRMADIGLQTRHNRAGTIVGYKMSDGCNLLRLGKRGLYLAKKYDSDKVDLAQ